MLHHYHVLNWRNQRLGNNRDAVSFRPEKLVSVDIQGIWQHDLEYDLISNCWRLAWSSWKLLNEPDGKKATNRSRSLNSPFRSYSRSTTSFIYSSMSSSSTLFPSSFSNFELYFFWLIWGVLSLLQWPLIIIRFLGIKRNASFESYSIVILSSQDFLM